MQTLFLPGMEPAVRTTERMDRRASSTMTVVGTVNHVLHVNADTGYSVFRVTTPGNDDAVVAGPGDALVPGDRFEATGTWVVDAKYGRQFKASFIRGDIPQTADGVAKYLESAISGVGVKAVTRLVEFYGENLLAVLDNPVAMMQAGLSEKQAEAIASHWRLRTRHSKVLSLLYAHNIGQGIARRIIDHYGESATRIVLTQPYRLAREVRGIGFRTADRIALSQALPKDSPERIRAAIEHQFGEHERNGNCAVPRQIIVQQTADLLCLSEALISEQAEAMLKAGDLIAERAGGREVVFTKSMHRCEEEVAAALTAMVAGVEPPPGIDAVIEAAQGVMGVTLHEAQRAAVEKALGSAVIVITGGPGVGKTLTIRTILTCWRQIHPDARVKLAAPTGRAAKRIMESTGEAATTVHRLLEWTPESQGFTRNREKPIDTDVLIVDEWSMADVWLMRDLLRALKPGTKLIMVGDADQLPSVGAGNVLADMIDSGVIPVARLTQVFRQNAGSGIAKASAQVNNGVVPYTTKPARSSDMWGVYSNDPAEIVEKIVALASDVMPRLGFDPLREIQVLTPGHENDTGTKALNARLQERINPLQPGEMAVQHKDREFRPRDRVIQVNNNYDEDVFNGDIGNVLSVFVKDGREMVQVDFYGKIVVYSKRELDQLAHAYAITIHKSQGSEFPAVVVVNTTQHFVMLRKNLLYTGISRARKLCCIAGSVKAVGIAVRSDGGRRLTGLARRLVGLASAAAVGSKAIAG